MKALGLGALISAALFAACFVDRASASYECTTSADCASLGDNRQCMGGYCVVSNCPNDCTTCDEVQRTCTAECTSADSCGSVTCPSGWTCTINCTGGNACRDIDCPSGSRCTVSCAGSNACGTVSCSNACKCDLACVGDACNTPECPTTGNGANQTQCTTDGTDTGLCDSAHAAGCAKC